MLVSERPTRWGSRQVIIDRVLEQSKALTQALSSDKKYKHLAPTWHDLEVQQAIYEALWPSRAFTVTLSGEWRSICQRFIHQASATPTAHKNHR